MQTKQMRIGDPQVVSELKRSYEEYEKAAGQPHGAGAPQAEGAIQIGDEVLGREFSSFGDAAGLAIVEFTRTVDGVARHGRQTQFWLRSPEGWRRMSAHIAFVEPSPAMADAAAYVDAAAAAIGLDIPPEYHAAVQAELSRIASIAAFLMEFPLAQDVEPAPVFRP